VLISKKKGTEDRKKKKMKKGRERKGGEERGSRRKAKIPHIFNLTLTI